MDLYFYFVQLIGFIGLLVLAYSYYHKDTNHILLFHIIAAILFCVHYFLLGAYSGLLICVYELIRDYSYYKTDADNYIFIGSILVYGVSAYLTFTTVLDLFPYIASLMDGYFLTKKRTIVVIGAIITYTLWLIYDLYAKSYSGAITDAVIIISNLYILIFRKEDKTVIVSKTNIVKEKN